MRQSTCKLFLKVLSLPIDYKIIFLDIQKWNLALAKTVSVFSTLQSLWINLRSLPLPSYKKTSRHIISLYNYFLDFFSVFTKSTLYGFAGSSVGTSFIFESKFVPSSAVKPFRAIVSPLSKRCA